MANVLNWWRGSRGKLNLLLISLFIAFLPAFLTADIAIGAPSDIEQQGTPYINQSVASLSVRVSTDKQVYLFDEAIAINFVVNFPIYREYVDKHCWIKLTVVEPDGSQQKLYEEVVKSGTYEVKWTAAPPNGNKRIIAEVGAWVIVREKRIDYYYDPISERYISYVWYEDVRHDFRHSAETSFRIFDPKAPISGQLLDEKTGKGIAGAEVSLGSTRQTTKTNPEGLYNFPEYKVGVPYKLVGGIPTVTEQVSVNAIASKPQTQSVDISAEAKKSVNFKLIRYFYPPMDLTKFTNELFSSWPEAKEYTIFHNMIGIAVEGAGSYKVEMHGPGGKQLPKEVKELRGLFFIPRAQAATYTIKLDVTTSGNYKIRASATLGGNPVPEASLEHKMEANSSSLIKVKVTTANIRITVASLLSPRQTTIFAIVAFIVGASVGWGVTGGFASLPKVKGALAALVANTKKLPQLLKLRKAKTTEKTKPAKGRAQKGKATGRKRPKTGEPKRQKRRKRVSKTNKTSNNEEKEDTAAGDKI